MLEVGTGDLSLSVRGLEQKDPQTVERFRAFCQSNFGLSQEVTDSLGATSDTIVLSIGASEEELRALAKVMSEIGALVEISRGTPSHDFNRSTLTHTNARRSNARVTRLFTLSTEQGSHGDSNSTLDPAEVLLSSPTTLRLHHDITLRNRRSLRTATRAIAEREPSLKQPPYRLRRRVMIGLCALLCTFAALSLFIHSYLTSESLASLPRFSMVQTDQGLAPRLPPPSFSQTLHGSLLSRWSALSLEVLISKTTVSVSSLVLAIEREGLPSLKAQAEPLFLAERAPGIWIGELLLSVVKDGNKIENATVQRLPITVSISNDGSAVAQVSLPSIAPDGELSTYSHSALVEIPLSER